MVAEILNYSMVLLTTLDGKEKKCNMYNVKQVSNLEVYIGSQAEVPTGAFPNSWTVSGRTPIVPALATLSICTTYSLNEEMISVYLHVNNHLGKKSVMVKIEKVIMKYVLTNSSTKQLALQHIRNECCDEV